MEHSIQVGNFLRAMEFVLVDKADAASRRAAADEMTAKMADHDAPRFLAFAEGQTTNNTRVIGFKDGAFRLRTAVQPVAISYKKSTCARRRLSVVAEGWPRLDARRGVLCHASTRAEE